MEDLKIKVTSEAESKLAQELLFQLGYKWIDIGAVYYRISPSFNYITAYCEGKTLAQGYGLDAKKEITITQIKDMVILKRNSVGDATHVDQYNDKWVCIQGEWYFYGGDGSWSSDFGDSMDRYTLTPITKNLKEYLNPSDWSLHLIDVDNDAAAEGWLEVPEGAEIAAKFNNGKIQFNKNGNTEFFSNTYNEWRLCSLYRPELYKEITVWQRHTQPEELPFISDSARRITPYEFNAIPDTTKVVLMRNGCSFGKTESLQQELRDMNVTLDERQSTYGEYRITAEITQDLISVLHSHGYENMPNTHKDAMQMIMRKMARIINGDHNHADSWHDISGYARLVENSIEDGEI